MTYDVTESKLIRNEREDSKKNYKKQQNQQQREVDGIETIVNVVKHNLGVIFTSSFTQAKRGLVADQS